MTTRDDDIVADALARAGWTGVTRDDLVAEWARQLDTPGGFQMFPAVREAFSKYGGLHIRVSGPGVDFAKVSFKIDPTLALGMEDTFSRARSSIGAQLYPLGEAYEGNCFVAMDELGAVYLLMDDEISRVASSMSEAIAAFVLGRRGR